MPTALILQHQAERLYCVKKRDPVRHHHRNQKPITRTGLHTAPPHHLHALAGKIEDELVKPVAIRRDLGLAVPIKLQFSQAKFILQVGLRRRRSPQLQGQVPRRHAALSTAKDGWGRWPDQGHYDNAFNVQRELSLRHVVKGAPFLWTLQESAKACRSPNSD
jgi:hypothetical protein